MTSLEARFWAKVDQSDLGGCWLWTASTRNGYGAITWRGRMVYAHRVSWSLVHGPIPAGLMIDHLCHTTRCVNPRHLRVVTHKQNMENRPGAQRNNRSTGVRGVYPNHGRWMARVKHFGKQFYAGTFDTIAEAEKAAVAKRLELFSHSDRDKL